MVCYIGVEINVTCVFAVGRGDSSSEVDTNEDSELSSHSIPSHYQTHTATGWFKHCSSGQLAVRKRKEKKTDGGIPFVALHCSLPVAHSRPDVGSSFMLPTKFCYKFVRLLEET